jgi:hypothetical protein
MDETGIIITMPDSSSKVVQDPRELSQSSLGVDTVNNWPLHLNEAPKRLFSLFQLFLTTPSHGNIEALKSSKIHIMHEGIVDTHRHYIVVDGANYDKLCAYLKSHKQREAGMCSSKIFLERTY